MTIIESRAGEGRATSAPAAQPIPDRVFLAVLSGLWLCTLLVVGLGGEVTVNDDWAYVRATEAFLRTGHIERVPWTYAPVVTNVLIGAVAAKVFGFSLVVLRMSSFFMGGVGMLAVYALARTFGSSRPLCALVAGTFGFGMMHLGIAYSFMTDVPYTALATASLIAFTLGLRNKSMLAFGVGLLATLGATLSRQTGVVIAAGVIVTLALARIRTRRDLWLAIAIFFGLFALAFVVERMLMGWSNFGVFRALTSAFVGKAPVYSLVSHSFSSQLVLGMAAFPLLLPLVLARGSIDARKLALGAALAVVALAFVIVKIPNDPYWGNLIDRGGLGPVSVHCATQRPMVPGVLFWTIAVASAAAGGLSVALIWFWVREVAWPERSAHPEKLFLFVSTVLYLIPVLIRNPYFNRYLIPVVPPVLVMVAQAVGRWRLPEKSYRWGMAGVLGVALFSSATTRDYLGHLGLRRELWAPLIEKGVSASKIEGGMEFDGHYRYMRPGVVNLPPTPHDNVWLNKRAQLLMRGPPTWEHPETYLVSFCRDVPGFHPVNSVERVRLVPPTKEKLYLLQRVGTVGAPSPAPAGK